jgi:trigger factor
LDTTVDKRNNSEALIKITLKEDDYQPRVNQKIKDFSKKANLKGFRPGKVPQGLIKKMYGNGILLEEVNQLVSEELNNLLRSDETQFLGEPMPSDEQTTIDWENQKEFEFLFDIGYAEDFEVKIDKKTKVELHNIKIDKKVIDETIDNLKERFGEVQNPETVSENDTVYGPVKSKDESINQEVSLELKEMKPAVAKKFIGLKVDESLELDLKKSFNDAEYFGRISRINEDELKPVKHKLTFTIKGINHVIPAEVNQDLFDKTFGKDTVKSEEEFRDKVKETVENNYRNETEQLFNFHARQALLDKVKIDLPDTFLKKWLQKSNDSVSDEVLDTEYENYAKELRWSLVRSKVVKDHELKIEHQDVKEEAKKVIIQQFGGPGIAEQLGDQLDQFADNYLQAENGDNYMKVYNQVQNQRVFELIRKEVSLKEKEVTLDEFRKITMNLKP